MGLTGFMCAFMSYVYITRQSSFSSCTKMYYWTWKTHLTSNPHELISNTTFVQYYIHHILNLSIFWIRMLYRHYVFLVHKHIFIASVESFTEIFFLLLFCVYKLLIFILLWCNDTPQDILYGTFYVYVK